MFAPQIPQMPTVLRQMTTAKHFENSGTMDVKLGLAESHLGPLFARWSKVRSADLPASELESLSVLLSEVLLRVNFRQRSNPDATRNFILRLCPDVSSNVLRAFVALFSNAKLTACEPYLLAKLVSTVDAVVSKMSSLQTPEGSPTHMGVLSPSKRGVTNNIILNGAVDTSKAGNGQKDVGSSRAEAAVSGLATRFGKENIGSQQFVTAVECVAEMIDGVTGGSAGSPTSVALLKDTFDATLARLDDARRSAVESTVEVCLGTNGVDASTVKLVERACVELGELARSSRTSFVFVDLLNHAEDLMKDRVMDGFDFLRPIQ